MDKKDAESAWYLVRELFIITKFQMKHCLIPTQCYFYRAMTSAGWNRDISFI